MMVLVRSCLQHLETCSAQPALRSGVAVGLMSSGVGRTCDRVLKCLTLLNIAMDLSDRSLGLLAGSGQC